MKKILLGTFILMGISGFVQGQNKAVYGELGGSGLVFSANYDMRFTKTENGFGFRAGVGLAAGGDVTVITFPFGLNYLTGKGAHHCEIGATATPITATINFLDDNETGSATFFMPYIGYRYGTVGKGFTGRIYVGPIIAGGSAFFPWGGISAGIKF